MNSHSISKTADKIDYVFDFVGKIKQLIKQLKTVRSEMKYIVTVKSVPLLLFINILMFMTTTGQNLRHLIPAKS